MPAIRANLSIRTGVYRGECIGYCYEEMNVTPAHVVHVKYALPRDPSQPDIVNEQRMGVRKWNKLVRSLDPEAFWALPRTIGDPDAADQGGEWLEVSDGERTQRVDLVLGAEIRELGPFLEQLRELRKQLSAEEP